MDNNTNYSNLTFHPYRISMTLFLAGLTMLFLALTGSYIYSRFQNHLPPLNVPWLFVFNTFILIGSSWTLMMAKRAYENDNTSAYKQSLINTILLSVVFMVSQYLAWKLMMEANITMQSSNASGYLYAISIIHFLHLVAGLPFLFLFYWKAKQRMKEPVSVLIYFSDPEKLLKLKLLTLYWHFLDILWVYLVLFFWVNSLIK